MKTNLKKFIIRGLCFSSLGPIIASIIYLLININTKNFYLTGMQVFVMIITTFLLSFIDAGSSIFYEIESWSPFKSIILNFIFTYSITIFTILINNWLPINFVNILLFTGIYIGIYLIIWLAFFISSKIITKKLNKEL